MVQFHRTLTFPSLVSLSSKSYFFRKSWSLIIVNCIHIFSGELYLERNMFTGKIPEGIGYLQNIGKICSICNLFVKWTVTVQMNHPLHYAPSHSGWKEILHLGFNELVSSIPISIGNFSKLSKWYLFPLVCIAYFCSTHLCLETLATEELHFEYNSLTGMIPESIRALSGLGEGSIFVVSFKFLQVLICILFIILFCVSFVFEQ